MKIGIVGLGSIGMRHYKNAAALGHNVKGFDPANSAYSAFRREVDVYEWCDACIVATPSHFHEGPLRACIERGKHVLVEKPISTDIGGLPLLLATAAEKGLTIMVGNNLRFHPAVKDVAGTPSRPLWANFICATKTDKPTYQSDGVVLCTGAHEVDLAMHLFGPAEMTSAAGIHDEMAQFTLRHNNGVRSSFHLDFTTPREVRQFWIGNEGGNRFVDLPGRFYRTFYADGGDSTFAYNGSYDDDYVDELKAFVDRIQGGLTRGADGEDGLAVLRVLLDVRKRIAFQMDGTFRA